MHMGLKERRNRSKANRRIRYGQFAMGDGFLSLMLTECSHSWT